MSRTAIPRLAKPRQVAEDPTIPEAAAAPLELKEIVNMIGPKVAGLRKAQGYSLQQLAVQSDVSAAAIHKIERSGMVPTITTLLKLAGALGVPVSSFVAEDSPVPEPIHFTEAGARRAVYTPHKGLALQGISGSYRQFQTAAAIARVSVNASSGEKHLQHPGEELVYVLEGQVVFTVGEHVYTMHPGDALHFGGATPHRWENRLKKPAQLLWIALRNG